MKIRRLTAGLWYSVVGALVLATGAPSRLFTHDHDGGPSTEKQKKQANALVKVVREATKRYKDVSGAEADGYVLQFGCVSGGDTGAMGLHYVNGALVGDGALDATRPEIVIYEPLPNGGRKLIGADYLVLAEAWHATHSSPPELMGPAPAPVREPQSLRAPGLLHAARLGVEGQPHGHVRQLARERLV
jgi:hypothetical protein